MLIHHGERSKRPKREWRGILNFTTYCDVSDREEAGWLLAAADRFYVLCANRSVLFGVVVVIGPLWLRLA
ncbi:hypothetical protein [Lampropedia aestuarii]|uniref:hypothetical protein n=1 Tax=Lampropedia aestuarii TaxID=2562762 RepID=UPI002469C2C3|nr:hypothetical protein [Lampropedia aestuarii]MDH5856791.1 hypothetical protein [Lampropedia aestuarii]